MRRKTVRLGFLEGLNHIKSRLCGLAMTKRTRLDVSQQAAAKAYFFLLVFFFAFFAFLAFLAMLPSATPVGSMQVDIDMHR